MKHIAAEDEMSERAASYALGVLSQYEARSFEEHLAGGCRTCTAELREYDDMLASLAWTTADAPHPRLRESLMACIAEEAQGKSAHSFSTQTDAARRAQTDGAHDNGASDFLIIRAGDGEWRQTPDAGVLVKLLFVDQAKETVTTLVKLLPGARMPSHRHIGVEQCLVLQGNIHTEQEVLGAGDYNCATRGSIHDELWTENGAMLLIVAPERYELLEQTSG